MFKIIVVAAILMPWKAFTQTSKKEIRQEWAKVQPGTVSQGKMLHMAQQQSVTEFLAYYLDAGKEHYSKMYGHEKMGELYVDSQFIYFGHYSGNSMIRLMKVTREELAGLDYNAIDGREIRERFVKEIVPEEDKQRVMKKEKSCSMSNVFYDFTYQYLPATREVEITYRWRISCEFLYKIINKSYTARYSFDSGAFTNATVVNHKK
jgi:hypothetical protein